MPDLKARQPCHPLQVQESARQMSTKSFNLRRVCIIFALHYLAIDNFIQKRTRPNVSVSRRSWHHAPSRQGHHSLVMPEALWVPWSLVPEILLVSLLRCIVSCSQMSNAQDTDSLGEQLLIVSIDLPLKSSVRYSYKEEPVRPPPPARLPSFYSASSDQTESGRSTPTSLYQGIKNLPSTMLDNLSFKGARRSGVSTPHEFRPFSDKGSGYHRRQVRSEKNKHKRRKAEVFVSKNHIDSRSVNCRSLDYSACCPGDSTGGIHS